jgi:single-strand DNA-binding protein
MYHIIILVGNLGKDPEMRYTPSGQQVASFPVATNRRYTSPSGQPVQETTWFRVTVWGKQVEACKDYLHKGNKVLVEGHLNPDPSTGGPRIWESQNKANTSYEVTAGTVRFLTHRDDSGGNNLDTLEQESHYSSLSTPDEIDIPF